MNITRWALAWIIMASAMIAISIIPFPQNSIEKIPEKEAYKITSNGHSYTLECKQTDLNSLKNFELNSPETNVPDALEEDAYLKNIIYLMISRKSEGASLPAEYSYPQSPSGFPLYIAWKSHQNIIHLIVLEKCP